MTIKGKVSTQHSEACKKKINSKLRNRQQNVSKYAQ